MALKLEKGDPALLEEGRGPRLLVVFNLNWAKCDIHKPLRDAARELDTMIDALGVRQYVQYSLTSLGAGEIISGRAAAKAGLSEEVLDVLRQKYHDLRQRLAQTVSFRLSRETAFMLQHLVQNGHSIAAVHNGDTDEGDQALKRARLRDYFEARVYGSDVPGVAGRPGSALYSHAMRKNKTDPANTIIVAERPDDAAAACATKANVAAYISLENCPDSAFEQRRAQMRDAGVTAIATTPSDLCSLPAKIALYAGGRAP